MSAYAEPHAFELKAALVERPDLVEPREDLEHSKRASLCGAQSLRGCKRECLEDSEWTQSPAKRAESWAPTSADYIWIPGDGEPVNAVH